MKCIEKTTTLMPTTLSGTCNNVDLINKVWRTKRVNLPMLLLWLLRFYLFEFLHTDMMKLKVHDTKVWNNFSIK